MSPQELKKQEEHHIPMTKPQQTVDSQVLTHTTSECSETKQKPLSTSKQKPILVLINPHSGRGKSIAIYKKKLVAFLGLHELDHEVFITNSEARVHDFIHQKTLRELNSYRSIVVISGDGLLFETINALISRTDGEKASKIPIGLIPTGSGNGLAYTLIRQKHNNLLTRNEAIQLCCDQILKNETSPTDLVKIMYNLHDPEETKTIWSFLSLGWGLLADIDIDSEWLRKLGEFRFTLYGLLRSITSVTYKGRLSFKIAKEIKKTHHNLIQPVQQQIEHSKTIESNSTFRMYYETSNNYSQTNYPETIDNASLQQQQNTLPAHIEQLLQDDPDDWVHIEDKFVCLYAVYQTHINSVTKFSPNSTLTDGLIYLTFIRGKTDPCQLIKFFLSIEDGSHEQLPFVTVVPVESFIFQPLEESKIVVDGEVVSWNISNGPIIAEVVPKAINLLWEQQVDSSF